MIKVRENIKSPERAKSAQTDREIDRMVYDLYGLTGEEIKMVEGKCGVKYSGCRPEIAKPRAAPWDREQHPHHSQG